ncbi:MAG: hypothetical protein CM1200mP40_36050 [Gammaproteobacteria bacterium]|nr:MAG: hypothetical protein CM1200mP40_36050 [Gammaproteobacteria bacterium]
MGFKEQLAKGLDVILEIDWQGAEQICNLYPDACSIFILPPSIETLTERLQERAQDDYDTIESRMQQARSVIEHVAQADYVVVNDVLILHSRVSVQSSVLSVLPSASSKKP